MLSERFYPAFIGENEAASSAGVNMYWWIYLLVDKALFNIINENCVFDP